MSLNTIRAIMIINAKKGAAGGRMPPKPKGPKQNLVGGQKGWTDAARKKAAMTRKAKKKVSSSKKKPSLDGTDDVSRKARFALESEGSLDKAIARAEKVARESNRGGGSFNKDDAKLHAAVVARLKEQK